MQVPNLSKREINRKEKGKTMISKSKRMDKLNQTYSSYEQRYRETRHLLVVSRSAVDTYKGVSECVVKYKRHRSLRSMQKNAEI